MVRNGVGGCKLVKISGVAKILERGLSGFFIATKDVKGIEFGEQNMRGLL